jgi:hypothetical protein
VIPFAVANGTIWFAAVFVLLNGIVLLCRVRVDRNGPGAGTRRRGIHLSPAGRVRPASVAIGALLLLALVLVGGALYRRWWLAEAKRVLHESVVAARTVGDDPPGVALTISGTPEAIGPSNFTGNYTRSVDRRAHGIHPLDTFAAPIVLFGSLQFRNGSRYEFNIQPVERGWRVWIGKQCGGEEECLTTIER